jgi:hypothetical protein
MGEKKKITLWYLKPLNPFTNNVISQHLARTCSVEEEDDLIDNEGNRHDVYRVEHSVISKVKNAKKSCSNIRFDVFYRNGNNGQLRKWKLCHKKNK